METLLDIVRQEEIEKKFNRKHIDGYIRQELELPENQAKIHQGVQLLTEWLNGDYYESKKLRLAQLKNMDLTLMVTKIFIGVAYYERPELFTSVTAQLASRLGMDDKRASILTMSEMLAVLCQTDAFDILKESQEASLMLQSNLFLSDEVKEFARQSQYLPPMVCEPLPLRSNYDSGYLTHKDSLILGQGNHHDGDICLDVLNKLNRVALKLDTEFLKTLDEEPTFDLDSADKRNQWQDFKKESLRMYLLMHKMDNKFYLTHKVDKRGRIYSQGYHISTQGTAYKKAAIELFHEEIVEGI